MKKFKVWLSGFNAFMSMGVTLFLYLSLLWVVLVIALGDSPKDDLYVLWTLITVTILASILYGFMALTMKGMGESILGPKIIRDVARRCNPILFILRKVKR